MIPFRRPGPLVRTGGRRVWRVGQQCSVSVPTVQQVSCLALRHHRCGKWFTSSRSAENQEQSRVVCDVTVMVDWALKVSVSSTPLVAQNIIVLHT